MSCRRVQSLLSAYLDRELQGGEMLSIGSHLQDCCRCDAEYHSLLSLKRLLGSLPSSRPQARLTDSLETLTDYSPLSVELFCRKRDLRRAFGFATPAENARAAQQANGSAAGMACALGVLSAWIVVAPAAIAPVAAHFQARHPRLTPLLRAAGWQQLDGPPEQSIVLAGGGSSRVMAGTEPTVHLTQLARDSDRLDIVAPPLAWSPMPQYDSFRSDVPPAVFVSSPISTIGMRRATLYSLNYHAQR